MKIIEMWRGAETYFSFVSHAPFEETKLLLICGKWELLLKMTHSLR